MRNLFVILLVLLASCKATNEKQEKQQTSSDFEVKAAKHFRFVTKNEHTVLQIINPDNGKTMIELLPMNGNRKIMALSSTFIGMLDKIDACNTIVGVSEMKYVSNSLVHQNFKSGKVMEAGFDVKQTVERIIAQQPEIIFHSGYNTDFPIEKQLKNVGITCVPVYDWREETPLGKAEWIKVYGFLLGKYDQANEVYNSVVKSYTELKQKASNLEPSKLLISGNVIGGEWCAPAGNSFMAQLMKDANITYNYFDAPGTGSMMSSQEKILSENKSATYWINPGAKSLEDLKNQNPKAVLFDAYNNKMVYCYYNNDQYYWEESSISPHLLLGDLIQIAHPEFQLKGNLHFYERLK